MDWFLYDKNLPHKRDDHENQNHKQTKTKIKKYKQRTKKYNQCLLLPSQRHNNIKDMKRNKNKAIFCGSQYLHVQQ